MGRRQHGVAYLWMLLAIFLLGLLLGHSLDYYSQQRQREREAALIEIGGQYREAIRQYYEGSPGYRKDYPGSLADLLADPRFITLKRYLRRLYPDPMTGGPWRTIPAPGGGIMGVYSDAGGRPLKRGGFGTDDADFAGAERYADWRFQYAPPGAPHAVTR